MSFDHFLWSSTGSAERPMTFALRRSNSPFIFAMVPSSVVQTGVKSLGCENSTAHLSPIHWLKSMRPSVVSAWKLGAVSPIRRDMMDLSWLLEDSRAALQRRGSRLAEALTIFGRE